MTSRVLMLESDFSQMELRILARESGDPEMVKCFVECVDIHRRTASMITGKPMDQVTKDDRQNAKPVNFGVVYGQTAKGLVSYARDSYGVTLTTEEAEKHLRSYFTLYRGVKLYQINLINKANEEGCVWVYWDNKPVHRRYVHYISSKSNKSLVGSEKRKVLNTPIQGGASLYTLFSLRVLYQMARRNMIPGLIAIVCTVHDSIWFEVYEDQVKDAFDMIGRIMVGFPCATRDGISIPIEVEAKIGPSIGEFEEFGSISSSNIQEGKRFDYDCWQTEGIVEFF